MARGKSGRIVLEISPQIKRNLYLALEKNQITLKDWFVEAACSYISSNLQSLFLLDQYVAEQNTNEYSTEKYKGGK